MDVWLLLGVGLYLTIRMRGVQFRLLPDALRSLLGGKKSEAEQGAVSSFQAVCTALSGTLGTGNIAGVAGAIALGGPGAVFWMWMAALLGMATKYAEVLLAMRYRQRNAQGEWAGGPMHYIEHGMGKRYRPLAVMFCLFGMLSSLGIGNMAQVNTLSDILCADNRPLRVLVGLLAAAAAWGILSGGMRRVARVAEKLIPWVSAVYIVSMLCVILLHARAFPQAVKAIVLGAFCPEAFVGGAAGITVKYALRAGISRGLFTHEAGMGSSPIAHACVQISSPVQQALMGIFEVFADTLVLCTITALGILCSGCDVLFGRDAGAALTAQALATVFGESTANVLLCICLGCFAFSTLMAWSFYGLRCAEYTGKERAKGIYQVIFSAAAFVGALLPAGDVWQWADQCNILMALPNLLALMYLSGEAANMTEAYLQAKRSKKKRRASLAQST